MRVLIKSPFSMFSGYGQDGWGLARALHRWGCDVYLQPTWVDVPVPHDLLPLLGKQLDPPFDLLINHWDPSNLFITPEARQCARMAVAWTMWEFAPDPVNGQSGLIPICKNRSSLRKRLKWFDLVLGYDQVTMASLDPYIPKHVAKGVLLGGYESADWKFARRDWHGEFMFGMHGALNNRKQPFMVLEAFRRLKSEHPEEFAGARLAFHTMTPPLFPELTPLLEQYRIKVFFEAWDHDTLQKFYEATHCLVYPSHGEGKNVPALEHMTTGGVVIHTNYGGPEQWLREDLAYPLDYEMVPLPLRGNPEHGPHWAQPSMDDLMATMWHVFTHRDEARLKGELASRVIPAQLDWAKVCEDLFRRIRDLCPHNGELIYNLAYACRRDVRQVSSYQWNLSDGIPAVSEANA
jgi:glycosyltransferase involved in cell wall biosynthesis